MNSTEFYIPLSVYFAFRQRMIDGLIPSIPFSPENPDGFLTDLPKDVWEPERYPVGHHACDVASDVCLLHRIAMQRRQIRLNNGALVLTKHKLCFNFDEYGNPVDVFPYFIRESNQVIEEYMLLANYLVAQQLIITVGRDAFLRHHPPPKPKELEELKVLTNSLGIAIDLSSSQALQESLNALSRNSIQSPHIKEAINNLVLKPMNLANYIVASDYSPVQWRHFALAIPYYTHFTSPIRRLVRLLLITSLSCP
jgi:DIS3-like exonuclease 2